MEFSKKIFSISSEREFNDVALEMFEFQMANNSLYAAFVKGVRGAEYGIRGSFATSYTPHLAPHTSHPKHYTQIPCLPIEFFKSHKILINGANTDQYFASSGTTGANTSKHFIADIELYERSFTKGFEYFFGSPENYIILALLPNYLEQKHSSLIYMMKSLIERTGSAESGFYLNNLDDLNKAVRGTGCGVRVSGDGYRVSGDGAGLLRTPVTRYPLPVTTILFGVSYALLNFAEQYPQPLKNTIIFETGGMKGRREELSKTELHRRLCEALGVEKIYSEYGMTELFSQAWSKGENIFSCPPWMRVFTRPLNNPSGIENHNVAGGINVIDLANYNSCPFIATQDLGRTFDDGGFEILGRMANSDVRGCSLLIAE